MPDDDILVPIPDSPGPIVGLTNSQPGKDNTVDPVTAAASAAAQAAAKAALTYLATKAAEGAHCRPNMDDAPIMDKTFCMVVRGLAGSDEKEFKERLNSQLADITKTIGVVSQNVSIINDNVNRLLKEMDLLHLEIGEVLSGTQAYSAIQDINVRYNRYAEVFAGIDTKSLESLASTGGQATTFFKDMIYSDKLYDKIDIIHNALLNSLPGKECLLRNAIRQISVKGENKPLLDCYTLYEQYVNAVMVPLHYGNLIVENAVTLCEVLAQHNKPDLPALPFSTEDWKKRWQKRLETLLAGFNSHLEWFVLERSAEAAKGINPFFLPADARQTFWRADAFCSRYLGYGLRGRIFSMADQFNGALKFKDGATAVGVKSAVQIGQKLDYWSATTTPGVYDTVVGFSDEWTVHRFYIPNVTAGSKALDITRPYSPAAIAIGKINEKTFQASDQPSSTDLKPFGSFVEIARAGGGFAFLSGSWVAGNADGDSSNTGSEPDIGKVTEYRNPSEYEITDGSGMVAKVSRPEVGLVKGGWVNRLPRRSAGAGPANHLNGSFRTWLEMAKTISFPAMGNNEGLHVVASLVPVDGGGLQGTAATLNIWLYGPAARLTKPKADITDDEVRRKLVIIGVNYDPSLAIPGADNSVTAGFRLCTVKEGKVGSTNEISAAYLNGPRHKKDIFREDVTLDTPRVSKRSMIWEVGGAVSLKFRLEAFYDFSLESSGLDVTPFAIYALGRLENVYLEVKTSRRASAQLAPPSLEGVVKLVDSRCFAFDYNSRGRLDHIVGYCSGQTGYIYSYGRGIDGTSRFSCRYNDDGWYALLTGAKSGDVDLKIPDDRVFAFDYNGSGKLDHLLFYRPGGRTIDIRKKNKDGYFEPVYTSRTGILRYDLANPKDRAFAFDYDGSGKLDHLVLYRPGGRALDIFKKQNDGSFKEVYYTRTGIGGFDLLSGDDRALAFDYDGSGKLDHLVLYRPGGGAVDIFKNKRDGSFETVYTTRKGIGGYDLATAADRAIAFDYNSVGKLDHLMFYRPGRGACYIVKRTADGKGFEALPGAQGDPGGGLILDLKNPADRAFAFDYDGFGKLDHLVLYRPGVGPLIIVKKGAQPGHFVKVYGY